MARGGPAALRSPATEAAEAATGAYFAAVHSAFADARARSTAADYTLAVGPWSVRLSFAGAALPPVVTAPLANVAPATPVEPDATICIFDSASTGAEPPPFPWRPSDVRERGEVQGHNGDRFRTTYVGDALSMFDLRRRVGIFWTRSAELLSWWERSEPLRSPLHWALNGDDRCLIHAAGVADDDGVVLLAGSGGAGKTTTTLACVRDGLRFVGDNYVLASLGREPIAHALYSNAKLRPPTLELLPDLAEAVNSLDVDPDEKFVIDVNRWRPRQLATGLPVKAVVVTTVRGHGDTRLVPASPVRALLALAPTTVYQLPGNGGALGAMAEIVRRVPSYTLELGAGVAAGPRAIRDLLAGSG